MKENCENESEDFVPIAIPKLSRSRSELTRVIAEYDKGQQSVCSGSVRSPPQSPSGSPRSTSKSLPDLSNSSSWFNTYIDQSLTLRIANGVEPQTEFDKCNHCQSVYAKLIYSETEATDKVAYFANSFCTRECFYNYMYVARAFQQKRHCK